MSRFIFTALCGFFFFCSAAKAQQAPTFPERVRAFLDSDWTELSITTALCTDYGEVKAVAVRLKRETPKSPVTYSLPLGKAAPEKAVVNEKDLATLCADVMAAAKATFAHQYPVEMLNSVPPEKAKEMIRSGAVSVGPTDVEMLVIRGKNTAGEVKLIEYGPFSPLDGSLKTLFHTETKEVRQADYEVILGLDPFKDE